MKEKNDDKAIDREGQPAEADNRPVWWPRRMTRSQVARKLGKALTSVRRLEGKELHPIKDATGTHFFDPGEVDAFATIQVATMSRRQADPEGEQAAAAFEVFAAGHGVREAVIRLRRQPRVIRALHHEWLESGDLVLQRDDIRWLRKASSVWLPEASRPPQIRNAEDLLALVHTAVDVTDDLRNALTERDAELKDLERANRKLRARLEEARGSVSAHDNNTPVDSRSAPGEPR
ncbi:MAG: hypothetical protein HYY06_10235 [Deltaproteobacteria bacterium]|nr:hypothetical protein [Deltaproteobacteria bacterium]